MHVYAYIGLVYNMLWCSLKQKQNQDGLVEMVMLELEKHCCVVYFHWINICVNQLYIMKMWLEIEPNISIIVELEWRIAKFMKT